MIASDKKKILVIGAGWEQYSLIKKIKDEGHYIIATHPNLSAEGFQLADTFYIKDSRDISAHISIAETHKIDAVVSDNCDYSFYTAAIVASKLGLPFADLESAIFSNDKFLQREACKTGGILQPEYYSVITLKELHTAAARLGYPVIVKPIDSRGTFGVTIVDNDEKLNEAFYNAIDNSPSRRLICEKFIKGTLVTVDGFCFKNGHRALTVASRKFEEGPKPVTKEIIYPAEFPKETQKQLLQRHREVVQALGYSYGHTHGEYMLTSSGDIYLIECANRGGGVYTSSVIVPLLTGFDLNLSLLNQSLGADTLTSPETDDYMKMSVILTFLDFQVGSVIRSMNIKEMQNKLFTVRFRSIYSVNDMVESIENCASRHSMLVLSGVDVKEAKNNLEQFKKQLYIEYYN